MHGPRNTCTTQGLYCALTDPNVFEKSYGPGAACPVIAHGFPRSWPFNCPGGSCDIGINLVAYIVVTCASQVPTVFSFRPLDLKNPYVYPLEFHVVHMQVACGPMRMPYKILIPSVVWVVQRPRMTHERSERGSYDPTDHRARNGTCTIPTRLSTDLVRAKI